MIRHLAAIFLLLWPVKALPECRQALALGLDVSGSVDPTEYRLQLSGIVTALRDPAVISAFLALPQAPVRLMIYEWSGLRDQRILVEWTDIQDNEDLVRLAARLETITAPSAREGSTALSAALRFGARSLSAQPCWRKVMDISGDGPGNLGMHPRDLGGPDLDDITVNALVVGPQGRANTTKDLANVETLEQYFRSHVIRGPDAFAETARDYKDFARAMRRKLIRELRLPGLAGSYGTPQ
ncbi:DUF1194 domain-containing protein [Roseovarius aestuariivivens]|uniref:DUF1194 domain-containing protein n=1 Tax=Roseovarius aestuariivivens TaxID=1888910 RepID=UPI00108067B2|nr:DUF1194 domain-containing protein [Roseovarius aestuariivivens]